MSRRIEFLEHADKELTELFSQVDREMKTLAGDTAVRFCSALLKNALLKAWEEAETEYKEGKTDKRLLNKFGQYLLDCIDHPSKMVYDREELIIFEPYTLETDQLKELIAFCEEKNFDIRIDGESPHFPGKTVRVILADKK